jgi:subtilisin-like proprotein convertase family protein
MHVVPLRYFARLAVTAALAGAGLTILIPGTAAAAGVPCQRAFSAAPALAITDNTTISDVIDVPEDGLVVSDINVTVNIHHTFDEHLIIGLTSETDTSAGRGSFVTLFQGLGGVGDNLINTQWDDEAETPISWGDAPFTGRFKGLRPLTGAEGFAGGQYRLQVDDSFVGDTGTLDSWTLTLRYASCDLDSDGVEDHSDSCLGVSAHTATGCPVTTRALTAKYRHGKFKGALSSAVAGCKAAKSVTIWKVRKGADKRVGTAATRTDGVYKLRRAKHAGRYYATSARLAVTDVAECPAAQSRTFRIR